MRVSITFLALREAVSFDGVCYTSQLEQSKTMSLFFDSHNHVEFKKAMFKLKSLGLKPVEYGQDDFERTECYKLVFGYENDSLQVSCSD